MRLPILAMMFALSFVLAVTPTFAAPAPTDGRKTFSTPDAAVNALVDAVAKDDTAALLALFGPDGKSIVSSGDAVADRNNRKKFTAMAAKQCRLVVLDGNWAAAKIGTEGWMFPVPIVKSGAKWFFDTTAGRQELLDERIGHNEIYTMGVCHAYVDAQRDYHAGDHTGRGPEYAVRLHSSPGKQDGLYWPTTEGQAPSPMGPLVASATAEGYDTTKHTPKSPVAFHGYFYRILTAQGDHAPGGRMTYLSDGRMTGGFALVAWPANYGTSGVMTFIVGPSGIVWQKDLGAKTSTLVRLINEYDPDSSWTPAEP